LLPKVTYDSGPKKKPECGNVRSSSPLLSEQNQWERAAMIEKQTHLSYVQTSVSLEHKSHVFFPPFFLSSNHCMKVAKTLVRKNYASGTKIDIASIHLRSSTASLQNSMCTALCSNIQPCCVYEESCCPQLYKHTKTLVCQLLTSVIISHVKYQMSGRYCACARD
jgi:hypothetical protein